MNDMDRLTAVNETLAMLTDELARLEGEKNEILSAKYALERVRYRLLPKNTPARPKDQ